MIRFRSSALLTVICMLSIALVAQQQKNAESVRRDPQAIQALAQVLAKAGGAARLSSIRDFRASGTVTYFWTDEGVTGAVTVKGLGMDHLRLDAELPEGVRTWVVSRGDGFLKEANGTATSIPYRDAVAMEYLIFPVAMIAAALQDDRTSVLALGVVTRGNQQCYQIRLRKSLGDVRFDPSGSRARIETKDIFIEVGTYNILSVKDRLRLDAGNTRKKTTEQISSQEYTHEVIFGAYRNFDDVLIPTSVTEFGGGQMLCTINLRQITFNAGINQSEFEQ